MSSAVPAPATSVHGGASVTLAKGSVAAARMTVHIAVRRTHAGRPGDRRHDGGAAGQRDGATEQRDQGGTPSRARRAARSRRLTPAR